MKEEHKKEIDKIITTAKQIADDRNKIEEKRRQAEQYLKEEEPRAERELEEKKLQIKQDYCNEEKEAVKEEFNRICGMLKKTDPTTDKYEKLSDSLYNLKKLLSGWNGYDY